MLIQNRLISEVFLGLLVLIQGASTLGIDLARTHATNPDWPGHARFHVVWQAVNAGMLAVLTEGILWSHLLPGFMRFHLALAITLIPMFGYIAALISRSSYRGTLRDRYGVAPLIVTLRGAKREIDLNSVAVYAGLFTSAVLLVVHDWHR